jgi:hypothetical protein
MKRLFAVKERRDEQDIFAASPPVQLFDRVELDTPTKPKSKQILRTKRKIDLEASKDLGPNCLIIDSLESPTKRLSKSPKRGRDVVVEDALKTPVRSSKRLGIKRKAVPLFDIPKEDSTDESPSRKVHFGVVPGSDPFYSPKGEARVPDIQSESKPLFHQVFSINLAYHKK